MGAKGINNVYDVSCAGGGVATEHEKQARGLKGWRVEGLKGWGKQWGRRRGRGQVHMLQCYFKEVVTQGL